MFPVFVYEEKKIIFITSLKCAYSSLVSYMRDIKGLPENTPVKIILNKCKLNAKKDYSDYKIIRFYRSPYKRILSNFVYWFVRIGLQTPKYQDHPTNKYFNSNQSLQFKTFRKFIKIMYKQKMLNDINCYKNINFHFKDQVYFLKNNQKLNEYPTYKFVNIDENGIKKLNKELNLKIPHTNFLNYEKNKQKNINNYEKPPFLLKIEELKKIEFEIPNYEKFYNKRIKRMIEFIYKDDFDYFAENGIYFSFNLNFENIKN